MAFRDAASSDEIVDSQCWADPALVAEGLDLGEDDDLLCITGAGCNVMALSLWRPRSLVALDLSAAQNALLELALAALRTLSWGEYVAFLGARPTSRRLALYRNTVRAELGDSARRFFDSRPRLIARGAIHAGRIQRYLRYFRMTLLPLIHGRATIEEFMTLEDPEIRRQYYEEHWDNRRWRSTLRTVVPHTIAARARRLPAFRESDLGMELLRRARKVMLETNPLHNHFLQYAMLGRYPDLERGPHYLRESTFETLRETTANLTIVTGDLAGYLAEQPADRWSKHYLSDLFECVDAGRHPAMLAALARTTRAGGRIFHFSLVAPSPTAEVVELVDRIDGEPSVSRALESRNPVFAYSSIQVQTVS